MWGPRRQKERLCVYMEVDLENRFPASVKNGGSLEHLFAVASFPDILGIALRPQNCFPI